MALFCCLLLLAPMVCARCVVLVRTSLTQESTEESRETNEEERTSEDAADPRSHARRVHDEGKPCSTLASICGAARGSSLASLSRRSIAASRAEHELRNGLGSPLRC